MGLAARLRSRGAARAGWTSRMPRRGRRSWPRAVGSPAGGGGGGGEGGGGDGGGGKGGGGGGGGGGGEGGDGEDGGGEGGGEGGGGDGGGGGGEGGRGESYTLTCPSACKLIPSCVSECPRPLITTAPLMVSCGRWRAGGLS
eukprot:scaffold1095_cov63-Phaeocystis_antarctica.AAC.10